VAALLRHRGARRARVLALVAGALAATAVAACHGTGRQPETAVPILVAGLRPGVLVASVHAPAAAAREPRVRLIPDAVATLPIRDIRFDYRTHDGKRSYALLLLPGWYGPHHDPAIPLVISPHGRNTLPASDAKRWSDLPARGGFAVVLPAGRGRVLPLDSWGYPGQIDDLARMPQIVRRAVPWLHYRPNRVYAVGASMGGQEVLLLLAHAPRMLRGVIAFDPAVNLAARYYAFPHIPLGALDQKRCRIEVGGTPSQVPAAYRVRSPSTYVRQIARSGVPLELWWSLRDRVIQNQAEQAGRFYEQIKQTDPEAPVVAFVGTWRHAAEVGAHYRLPYALARIGLLPRYWLHHDPYRLRIRHSRAAVE
jgi:predicted esterase